MKSVGNRDEISLREGIGRPVQESVTRQSEILGGELREFTGKWKKLNSREEFSGSVHLQ